jgi:hypothetical protein
MTQPKIACVEFEQAWTRLLDTGDTVGDLVISTSSSYKFTAFKRNRDESVSVWYPEETVDFSNWADSTVLLKGINLVVPSLVVSAVSIATLF